jgi:hypothetical protein
MDNQEEFFLKFDLNTNECLLALKAIILKHNPNISSALSYGMPFFYFKGQRFCYLWVSKKYKKPYIGFVDGHKMNNSALLQEARSRMKIFHCDQNKDLPIEKIYQLLDEAIGLLGG